MDLGNNKLEYNLNIESELTNLPFPGDRNIEEKLISTMITPPSMPEGGFGWLTVIATFFLNFTVDGINGSAGIILPELQRYYNSSIEETTLVLSLLILFTYISSPMAAILMDKLKPRTIVIFFGLIATLSVTLTYFVVSVKLIAFTFGVLPGISFSMCVMCAQVMISLYFDKKRALAYSITGVGSGLGSILMPFLTSMIVNKHGFRFIFFFWGGLCFLLLILGPLYFPLKLAEDYENNFKNQSEKISVDLGDDSSAVYMRDLGNVSIDPWLETTNLISVKNHSMWINFILLRKGQPTLSFAATPSLEK
ncbi:monocarboxylate transporter 12-like [Octopus sinensis]|uniref:Monocarboxylate transporter 12-like n=1 Tax=Octopus sinensis TaxID=2607531 RepID=A0A6P7TZE3_9MOLL|nr:monocarboxylate transporter 12-like [Octopus sinensis]